MIDKGKDCGHFRQRVVRDDLGLSVGSHLEQAPVRRVLVGCDHPPPVIRLGFVTDAVAAGNDRQGNGLRFGSRHIPGFAGGIREEIDQDHRSVPAAAYIEIKAFVGFLVHEHVGRLLGPHPVTPDPVRPVGGIEGVVEEVLTAGVEGSPVIHPMQMILQLATRFELEKTDLEGFIPGEVDRVGETVLVGTQQEGSQCAITGVLGDLVLVKENEGRAVGRIFPAHEDRVLLALLGPVPVPPVPLAGGGREVVLLHLGLDFLEDLPPQRS